MFCTWTCGLLLLNVNFQVTVGCAENINTKLQEKKSNLDSIPNNAHHAIISYLFNRLWGYILFTTNKARVGVVFHARYHAFFTFSISGSLHWHVWNFTSFYIVCNIKLSQLRKDRCYFFHSLSVLFASCAFGMYTSARSRLCPLSHTAWLFNSLRKTHTIAFFLFPDKSEQNPENTIKTARRTHANRKSGRS